MRFIGSFKDPQIGQKFSVFLNTKNIHHELEVTTNTDWGNHDYGTISCKIWVIEEEQFQEAKEWLEKFQEDPFDSVFAVKMPTTPPPPPKEKKRTPEPTKSLSSDFGRITTAILISCILLFVFSTITKPTLRTAPTNVPLAPLVTSPVKKVLLYDYPLTFSLTDQLVSLYGIDSLYTPSKLPSEGQFLLKKIQTTPYWQGIYPNLVTHAINPSAPWNFPAPLFEKIKQGEIWRLVTPCFLHFDIFHILFNMLWLIVLGRQLEKQLGAFKYILFILIVGILSNTGQYMMSGSNFIGYSGVICGMITFVWVRQKLAPWEGYQLHPSTFLFITVFVFAILGIQMVSFFLEVNGHSGFSAGVANTAHITGGIIGYILGRTSLFSWK